MYKKYSVYLLAGGTLLYLCAAAFLAKHKNDPSIAPSTVPILPIGSRALMTAISIASSSPGMLPMRSRTSGCSVRGPLPDPACSPGATFTSATTIEICVQGYTKKVRNVSAALKKKIYQSYNIPYPQKTGSYELDHLIPLELGGSNEPANLFPEARDPSPGFREKDIVENFLHQESCEGRISLDQAQKAIATDWVNVYQSLGGEEVRILRERFKSWADGR